MAIATGDGFVRIFNFNEKELIGKFKSYFGAILCIAWSGDGLLLAAGGEDDLIHIYSMDESRVILRCQGHKSWVSALAFDHHYVQSRNRESMLLSRTISHSHNRKLRSYRLGSVSHDTHFCFWDIDDSVLLATRKSRTRSMGNSVSHCSQTASPRTSESQAVTPITTQNPSAQQQSRPPAANLSRSNSLPGSKVNNVANTSSSAATPKSEGHYWVSFIVILSEFLTFLTFSQLQMQNFRRWHTIPKVELWCQTCRAPDRTRRKTKLYQCSNHIVATRPATVPVNRTVRCSII